MKYNKSEIMTRAWNLYRSNVKVKTFSDALRKAWAEAKIGTVATKTGYEIPAWFYEKNLDKLTSAHLVCYHTFFEENIIRETEKAVYVDLEMRTRSGAESKYSRKVWLPKSILYRYAV